MHLIVNIKLKLKTETVVSNRRSCFHIQHIILLSIIEIKQNIDRG